MAGALQYLVRRLDPDGPTAAAFFTRPGVPNCSVYFSKWQFGLSRRSLKEVECCNVTHSSSESLRYESDDPDVGLGRLDPEEHSQILKTGQSKAAHSDGLVFTGADRSCPSSQPIPFSLARVSGLRCEQVSHDAAKSLLPPDVAIVQHLGKEAADVGVLIELGLHVSEFHDVRISLTKRKNAWMHKLIVVAVKRENAIEDAERGLLWPAVVVADSHVTEACLQQLYE